jgi:tetratricopeptide (TPR) repeat protein
MKFVKNGMFIKLASTDPHGIYGRNRMLAAKSAAHEIKSLQALIDSNIRGLHFPLQIIVDYLGRRLSVSTILPIRGNETLIYGSSDGGRTIYSGPAEFRELIRQLATRMNLKEHAVAAKSTNRVFHLSTPVDMEGHLGLDGRYYICDSARLMPPEPPTGKPKGSVFCHLIRPEAVASNSVPISSDSFTNFGEMDRASHNEEARSAWMSVFSVRVAECARDVDSLFQVKTIPSTLEDVSTLCNTICTTMHSKGVNLRLLLHVRHACKSFAARNFLLCEALSRVMKQSLFYSLQNVHADIVEVSRLSASIFLTHILSKNHQAWLSWSQTLNVYFWNLNCASEPLGRFPVEPVDWMTLLLCALNRTNIRLCVPISAIIAKGSASTEDIGEILPKIKFVSTKTSVERLRRESSSGTPDPALLSVYEGDLIALRQRLGHQHPQVAFALENCSDICLCLGDYQRSSSFLQDAIVIRRESGDDIALSDTLAKAASVAHSFEQFDDACRLMEESHAIASGLLGENSQKAMSLLHTFAWMLKSSGDYERSATTFRRVIDASKGRKFDGIADTLVEYARVLMHLGRLGPQHQIEEMQRAALELAITTWGENHSRVATILNNLSIFLAWKGSVPEAIECCRRSLQIRQERLGLGHIYTGHSLSLLGQLLSMSGEVDSASQCLEQALGLYRNSKRSEAVGSGLANLCRLRILQGRFPEAQTLAEDILANVDLQPPKDHFATMLVDAALAFSCANDTNKLQLCLQSAESIRQRSFPDGHPSHEVLPRMKLALESSSESHIDSFRLSDRLLVSQLTVYLNTSDSIT